MSSSQTRCKCLFLIQDGLGDQPLEELGGLTPLEAADTPHMDELLRRGQAGLMDLVAPGITVGTDIGHLALFGQDVERGIYFRGPMEAAGLGRLLEADEVALRFNFATVDQDLRILDRRAGRIREETRLLAEELNRIPLDHGQVRATFLAATEHRGVLILKGAGLSPAVTDADPGKEGLGLPPLPVLPKDSSREAHFTAALVNYLIQSSFRTLQDHPVNRRRVAQGLNPANLILTRGAGRAQTYRNLPQRLGLRMACVSGECTVLGLARLAGMEAISSQEMTANLDTNLEVKASLALRALEEHDVVYLHLKGCDIAGHDRAPLLKKEFIERTDRMVGLLKDSLAHHPNLLFAFAADHSTLSRTGEHSADPVPVFLSGPGIAADSVRHYGETSCRSGALGRLNCRHFLNRVFSALGLEATQLETLLGAPEEDPSLHQP